MKLIISLLIFSSFVFASFTDVALITNEHIDLERKIVATRRADKIILADLDGTVLNSWNVPAITSLVLIKNSSHILYSVHSNQIWIIDTETNEQKCLRDVSMSCTLISAEYVGQNILHYLYKNHREYYEVVFLVSNSDECITTLGGPYSRLKMVGTEVVNIKKNKFYTMYDFNERIPPMGNMFRLSDDAQLYDMIKTNEGVTSSLIVMRKKFFKILSPSGDVEFGQAELEICDFNCDDELLFDETGEYVIYVSSSRTNLKIWQIKDKKLIADETIPEGQKIIAADPKQMLVHSVKNYKDGRKVQSLQLDEFRRQTKSARNTGPIKHEDSIE